MDAFSERTAPRILAQFPDWRAHCREEEHNGACYFVVELPSPSESDLAHPLRIDTNNEEITVSLDYYHSHFDDFGAGEARDDALCFIRDVLEEGVAVVSWWSAQEWCGSTVLRPGETPAPGKHMASCKRVRIRSWQGTLDRDIDLGSTGTLP